VNNECETIRLALRDKDKPGLECGLSSERYSTPQVRPALVLVGPRIEQEPVLATRGSTRKDEAVAVGIETSEPETVAANTSIAANTGIAAAVRPTTAPLASAKPRSSAALSFHAQADFDSAGG